jgi:predicted Fe-S protein YdhL (DUF1289 family)
MNNNVCIGCKRTIEEIRDWAKLSEEEKAKIVNRIKDDTKSAPDTSQH